jgi:hypothetical protein
MTTSVKDKKVNKYRTISEMSREAFDEIMKEKVKKEKIIEILDDVYNMAKRMNTEIKKHDPDYDKGWWERMDSKINEAKKETRGLK